MSEELKLSSHLPDLINLYISTRAQRLVLDKQAAEVKEDEEALKNVIIAKFKDGDLTACGATNGLVKMTVLKEPVATDWPALYDYIKETGHWEFLHKRVTSTAIKEHWNAGETIPGVGVTEVYKLSVSK